MCYRWKWHRVCLGWAFLLVALDWFTCEYAAFVSVFFTATSMTSRRTCTRLLHQCKRLHLHLHGRPAQLKSRMKDAALGPWTVGADEYLSCCWSGIRANRFSSWSNCLFCTQCKTAPLRLASCTRSDIVLNFWEVVFLSFYFLKDFVNPFFIYSNLFTVFVPAEESRPWWSERHLYPEL